MKRIILVEDDASIRDAFEIIFSDDDCKITTLATGAKIMNEEVDAPDLFLLDKQMSGANGLDICRFIKNSTKFKHVPVLMLSANPDIKSLAAEAGADGAVSKPFSVKNLHETVDRFTAG